MFNRLPTDAIRQILLFLDLWDTHKIFCVCKSYTHFKKAVQSLTGVKEGDQIWMKCPCKRTAGYFCPSIQTTAHLSYECDRIFMFIYCPCGEKIDVCSYSVAAIHQNLTIKETYPRYMDTGDIMMGYYNPLPKKYLYRGNMIDAMDIEGVWYPAKILDFNDGSVLVHYMGWSHRFNEWIHINSPRLAVGGAHVPTFTPRIYDYIDFRDTTTQRWFYGKILAITDDKFRISTDHRIITITYNGENITWGHTHTPNKNNKRQYRLKYNVLSTEWKNGATPVYLRFHGPNIMSVYS